MTSRFMVFGVWILACVLANGIALAGVVDGYWSSDFYVNGTENPARAIATVDGQLVVGGMFQTAGPALTENVAWYDAAGWHAFPTSIPTQVDDLFLHSGVLTPCRPPRGVWRSGPQRISTGRSRRPSSRL